jgi:hypothetical protein
MPITRTPLVDDDGSGTTGTVLNNAWQTNLYNAIDALAGGTWGNVPFSAANFTAVGGGTWTVGAGALIDNRYMIQGKLLFWHFYLSWFSGSNTVAGTVTTLQLTAPSGLTLAANQKQLCPYAIDAGVRVDVDFTTNGATVIQASRRDGANWAAGSPGLFGNSWWEIT